MQVYLSDIMSLARRTLPLSPTAHARTAWKACEDYIALASYSDLARYLDILPSFEILGAGDSPEAVARHMIVGAQMTIERARRADVQARYGRVTS